MVFSPTCELHGSLRTSGFREFFTKSFRHIFLNIALFPEFSEQSPQGTQHMGHYKVIFDDEQRERVRRLASEGASDFTISQEIGCTKRMLQYRCRDELDIGRYEAVKNGILPMKAGGNGSSKGNRRIEITDEMHFQIQTMAGYGLTVDAIAAVMGMARMTLYAYCMEDLDKGRADGHKAVAKTLYEMATDSEHPSMTTFYLKTQCGWRETTAIEFPDENGRPQRIIGDTVNLNLNAEKMQTIIALLNEKV